MCVADDVKDVTRVCICKCSSMGAMGRAAPCGNLGVH